MMQETTGPTTADSGLDSLTLLLQFHGIAVDPAQIAHRFAGVPIDVQEMLRCAKELNLKARCITADWRRVATLSLPVIAEQTDGTFIILAKVTEEGALVHFPLTGRPRL